MIRADEEPGGERQSIMSLLSYDGIQLSGIGWFSVRPIRDWAGGYLRESGEWAGSIGLVVVLVGALLDPILERRQIAAR